MGLSRAQIDACNWVYFSVALVSLGCSLLTLGLIYHMNIRNGYLLLIVSMTVCQVIYDINFIQGIIPGYANCVVWNVFNILGGLSVSLWSNVISYVALFVIMEIRSMNIYQNYRYFCCIALLPPLVLSLASIAVIERPSSQDDDQPYLYCVYNESLFAQAIYATYYWGRILTIVFNFGVFGYVALRIYRMMSLVRSDELSRAMNAKQERDVVVTSSGAEAVPRTASASHGSGGHNIGVYPITATTQCMAIIALVSRMKWYPLAQALSRSGAAWNEFDNYRFDTFESNVMAAVCSPASGILNCLIFLAMQPKAWKTLVGFICGQSREDAAPIVGANAFVSSPVVVSAMHSEVSVPSGMRAESRASNPADLLDQFDEDELHLVINNMFLRSESGASVDLSSP